MLLFPRRVMRFSVGEFFCINTNNMKEKILYKYHGRYESSAYILVFSKNTFSYTDIMSGYMHGHVNHSFLKNLEYYKCQGVAFLSILKDLIDYINET